VALAAAERPTFGKLWPDDASPDRHAILTIRNLTRRAPRFIQRSTMSVITVNGDQTNAIPAITGSEVIPRINPKLFRERKELGICHRSVAFCHHRCDFGLADLRCRRCAERISSAHWELSGASPKQWRVL